ncbi:MAG: hypothetical protein AB4426_20390 [Xenococcaceae cyanobacterium]
MKSRVIGVIGVPFLTTEDEFGGQSQSHNFINHNYNPFCPLYKATRLGYYLFAAPLPPLLAGHLVLTYH